MTFEQTLRVINSRKRDLTSLNNTLLFNNLNYTERKAILDKGRLLINDINFAMRKFSLSDDFYTVFESSYRTFRNKYSRFVNVPRLTDQLRQREMDALRRELVNKVGFYSDFSRRAAEQNLAIWKEVYNNIDDKLLGAFQPRQVLFSVPKDIPKDIISVEKLRAYKQQFYRVRKSVQNILNSGIEAGYNNSQIFRNLRHKLKNIYSLGNVPVPYRHFNKRLNKEEILIRNMNLGRYTDIWIKDWHTISDSKAQIAGALAGGLDLVRIGNGIWADCPICKPVRNITYSITGKTKGYPRLKQAPPLHPDCYDKIIVLTP